MQNLLILILSLILAVSARAEIKLATIINDSAYAFLAPDSTQSSLLMLDKEDVFVVKKTVFDQHGLAWYQIKHQKFGPVLFWVPAASVQIQGATKAEAPANAAALAAILSGQNTTQNLDPEKKRRLSYIRQNPQWPLRIKSAIRDGKIILEMTVDQLMAAWGEPLNIKEGFLAGQGNVLFYFYHKSAEPGPAIVTLASNRVIGWNN